MTVVEFLPARAKLFRSELRRINAEFRCKRKSVNAWPPFWFESREHMECAQGQGFTIAIVQRLEQCAAAAKKYGVNPQPFEKEIKRKAPHWDRLKHCAPRDWDNPVIAHWAV
jgi:hypothetical protein